MYTNIRSSSWIIWIFTKYKEKIRGLRESKLSATDIGMWYRCLYYYCNYYEKQGYTGATENKCSKRLRKLPENNGTRWTQDAN